MTTQALSHACLLLGIALLLAVPGTRARAEEKPPAPEDGRWIFDVRVVRVEPATQEGAEAPDPLTADAACTTRTPWAQALSLLKQRGATTLLMDQRITPMDGERASAPSDRTVPIVAVDFRSSNDEQLRASNVKTGCNVELTPGSRRLGYALQVRWALTPPADAQTPEPFTAEWRGSHPDLDGETLVLRYRGRVPARRGDGSQTARAVEIYALVTGHLLEGRWVGRDTGPLRGSGRRAPLR